MSTSGYQNSFDGKGELAAGSVRGLRSWTAVPSGRGFHLDRVYDRPLSLTGQYGGTWNPGENVARCAPSGVRPLGVLGRLMHGRVPAEDCGCGFWAYWACARTVSICYDVSGIIEGYGLTLIGELGFRCQKARIIALAVGDVSAVSLLRTRYKVPVYYGMQEMLAEHPVPLEYGSPS